MTLKENTNRKVKKQSKWKRKVKMLFGFPHIWVCITIFLSAITALRFSIILNAREESFLSSLFSNIFAGLLTGLIICLINGSKQLFVSKTQEKKKWLDHLATMIQDYYKEYDRILHYHFQQFDGEEKIYVQIYDCGSRANWINDEICQSSFNQTLSFNSVEYCKNKFNYDAVLLSPDFETLHLNLQNIDIDCPSSKDIIKYFEKVNREIRALNSQILIELHAIDSRLSAIPKTVI